MNQNTDNCLTRITDADGNTIQHTLNTLGQRIKTEYFKTGNILVRESSAVFDDLDRQEQIIGAATQTTTFSYDAVGNRITAIDALARPATEYTYDTLSRLTNIKDANSKNTQYQYDDRDRLRYVTDPRGLITQYQYNALGQLTTLNSPDTGTTSYTYDLAGNRKTQTDARNITATYEYDALNRITGKFYPTASLNIIYTYDQRANGLGKLTAMTDNEGVTEYDYDVRGNMIEQRRTASGHPNVYVTHYDYDNNDRLVKITYPGLRTVAYTRNALGQVTSISTTPSGGSAVTVMSGASYLPFGTLEDMSYNNGLALDQTFDQDYRLTDQVLGTIYDRDYVYDAVNNIKDIIDNTPAAKTQSFNYDVLDRLDDATSSGTYGALDYAYDDVGNRTSLTVDTNPAITYGYSPTANQLTNIAGAAITYDANGNTQSKNSNTFSYDDMNRMTQANGITYGYNGKGERVRKTNGASITLYHYDETGNLLLETDGAGATVVEYLWLGSQRIAMVQGGSVYFNHTDHLGTPQLMTNSAGTVVWAADYKPFGEATVTTATIENNLRFPGQYFDQETGLHYNYFRDYDPSTGRYIESDPIGLAGGINTYNYADANAIINADYYGLARGSRGGAGSTGGAYGGGGVGGTVHIILIGFTYTKSQIVTSGGKVCTLTTMCLRFGPGLYVGGGVVVVAGGYGGNVSNAGGGSIGLGGDLGAGPSAGVSATVGSSGASVSGSLPQFPSAGVGASVGVDGCVSNVSDCKCP
jgi:RHS repeat-associated protein